MLCLLIAELAQSVLHSSRHPLQFIKEATAITPYTALASGGGSFQLLRLLRVAQVAQSKNLFFNFFWGPSKAPWNGGVFGGSVAVSLPSLSVPKGDVFSGAAISFSYYGEIGGWDAEHDDKLVTTLFSPDQYYQRRYSVISARVSFLSDLIYCCRLRMVVNLRGIFLFP
jgi:hypothetical protein